MDLECYFISAFFTTWSFDRYFYIRLLEKFPFRSMCQQQACVKKFISKFKSETIMWVQLSSSSELYSFNSRNLKSFETGPLRSSCIFSSDIQFESAPSRTLYYVQIICLYSFWNILWDLISESDYSEILLKKRILRLSLKFLFRKTFH